MDLLAELRAEREKHGKGNTLCLHCGGYWPCDTSRALDVTIAAAELHRPTMQGGCTECSGGEYVQWPCETMQEMEAAWEKGR